MTIYVPYLSTPVKQTKNGIDSHSSQRSFNVMAPATTPTAPQNLTFLPSNPMLNERQAR